MAQVYRVHSFLVILSDNSRYKEYFGEPKNRRNFGEKTKVLGTKEEKEKTPLTSIFFVHDSPHKSNGGECNRLITNKKQNI